MAEREWANKLVSGKMQMPTILSTSPFPMTCPLPLIRRIATSLPQRNMALPATIPSLRNVHSHFGTLNLLWGHPIPGWNTHFPWVMVTSEPVFLAELRWIKSSSTRKPSGRVRPLTWEATALIATSVVSLCTTSARTSIKRRRRRAHILVSSTSNAVLAE